MLNIIKILKKNKIIRTLKTKEQILYTYMKHAPLSKEWYNSVYAFNKNSIRFIPAIQKKIFTFFKLYFSMFNKNIITKKYLSKNKVWVSAPEIRNLNKKINLTVYIYSSLYNTYNKELSTVKSNLLDELSIKHFVYFKLPNNTINKYNIELINWLKLDKSIKMKQRISYIIQLVKSNKIDTLRAEALIKAERYSYLISQFEKELIYIKLKQTLLFNKFKFNELYLTTFINFLEIIYNKSVELNIVILKNYYLSSDILSQMILSKIDSKNPKPGLISAQALLKKRKVIPNLSSNKLLRIEKKPIGIKNIFLNKWTKVNNKQDLLNVFLLKNNKKSSMWSSKYVENLVLKNIEMKSVSGIFIKLNGRLSKRFKAQRALNIFKHIGTLKNPHSAHKGLSYGLSRGYANVNLDKTMGSSKTRIGAYGITGWVASY